MRQCTRKPIEDMQIDRIELELDSRDDIPQIIGGLQYIFLNPVLREEVLTLLDQLFPEEVDLNNGRPGMDRWSIFVMGVLRLHLNCDYDRLHNLVNNHGAIRQLLGHGFVDDKKRHYLQTLKDNVSLLTPDILDRINQVVVNAGHELVKKKAPDENSRLRVEQPPEEKLKGRCDSFVVETHVEYPTDTRLLFDALRKVIELLMTLCQGWGVLDEPVGRDEIRQLKK